MRIKANRGLTITLTTNRRLPNRRLSLIISSTIKGAQTTFTVKNTSEYQRIEYHKYHSLFEMAVRQQTVN